MFLKNNISIVGDGVTFFGVGKVLLCSPAEGLFGLFFVYSLNRPNGFLFTTLGVVCYLPIRSCGFF